MVVERWEVVQGRVTQNVLLLVMEECWWLLRRDNRLMLGLIVIVEWFIVRIEAVKFSFQLSNVKVVKVLKDVLKGVLQLLARVGMGEFMH